MSQARRPRRRNKPLRLLQFTDLHLGPDTDDRVRGVAAHDTFQRCLAHAREHHSPVDAVLLTGDLVQDDARGYLAIASYLGRERAKVHCLAGNHDLPGEMEALLARAPFDLSPVLRYGNWTLVMLNSATPGVHRGHLSADALAFLDDALSRFADSHALVVLHHQPVPVGSAWLDTIGLDNGPELMQLLAQHRNLRGLLWGHVHQSFDVLQDGVAMMATPATCYQFVPGTDDMAVDDRPPGYRWLHLYPDGRIETQVVWLPAD